MPASTQVVAESTAVPAPTPCTRSDGTIRPCSLRVPSTAWLIDVRSGARTTLFESHDHGHRYAAFQEAEQQVAIGVYPDGDYDAAEVIRFGMDGREVGREPWAGGGGRPSPEPVSGYYHWRSAWTPGQPLCKPADGGIEVEGRFYAEASCGPMSPDSRWMLFRTNEISDFSGPNWDQWVIDLEADRRVELETGLYQCYGDGFFPTAWSRSGRYVYYGDCAENGRGGDQNRGRTFLSDVEAGRTRQIASGLPTFDSWPAWSPVADTLLYRGEGGVIVLEDMHADQPSVLLNLNWMASFDPTGRYVYSPSTNSTPMEPDGTETTRVYDIETGRVVATLAGLPAHSRHLPFVPVAGTRDGFVAALEYAPGCDGTAIYAGTRLVTCVAGAAWPTISPDGSMVALARKTGMTGPANYPGGGSISLTIFDILIVDVATGAERVVAKDALGQDLALPSIWNAESTHIVLRWPFWFGI